MDKSVIKFSHCGKDIFCFFVPEECPECGTSFTGRRLEEAPISIPNPFTNGHKTPCAFLIAPAEDNTLRYTGELTLIHKGVLFSLFTKKKKKNLIWNGFAENMMVGQICILELLTQMVSHDLL